MARIVRYIRRTKYGKRAKKYIVGCASIIILISVCGLVTSFKLKGDEERISATTGRTAQVIHKDESKTDEESSNDSKSSNDSQWTSDSQSSNDNQSSNDDQSSNSDQSSNDDQSPKDDQSSKDNQSSKDDQSLKDDQSSKNTQSTSNDQSSNDENDSKANKSDNGDYLPLSQDPNADDVIDVFHTTEKLIKGESKYPVRKDGKKVVYLTFDDGPSTTNTPKVLDTLKANNIKATFFIMGSQINLTKESSEILKRTAKEGHAIGNHTYSHDYKYLYPNGTINVDNFMNDIAKCDKELKSVLGENFSTRTIRFPGGYWSWKGRENIKPVLLEKGYAIIDWNTLSEDAEGKPHKTADELAQITRRNLDSLGPNADSVVILMHDTYGKEETAKSVQPIINIFKEKGFVFRTMK